jgi:hypothetical protein
MRLCSSWESVRFDAKEGMPPEEGLPTCQIIPTSSYSSKTRLLLSRASIVLVVLLSRRRQAECLLVLSSSLSSHLTTPRKRSRSGKLLVAVLVASCLRPGGGRCSAAGCINIYQQREQHNRNIQFSAALPIQQEECWAMRQRPASSTMLAAPSCCSSSDLLFFYSSSI